MAGGRPRTYPRAPAIHRAVATGSMPEVQAEERTDRRAPGASRALLRADDPMAYAPAYLLPLVWTQGADRKRALLRGPGLVGIAMGPAGDARADRQEHRWPGGSRERTCLAGVRTRCQASTRGASTPGGTRRALRRAFRNHPPKKPGSTSTSTGSCRRSA